MSASSNDLEPQSFIQRWVLVIVGLVFLISFAFYFTKFHDGLSSNQEVWGQFGDFVGGLINPIIGFLTVWLLTVSLRQNQLALKQANEELQLARRALQDSERMQAKTEAALRDQIEIADQTRDIANAAAINSSLQVKCDSLRKARSNAVPALESAYAKQLSRDLGAAENLAGGLDRILNKEASRLLKRYESSEE